MWTVEELSQDFGTDLKIVYCYLKSNNTTQMAQAIFTLSPEMQQSWDYVMGQMLSFVNDTNADVDMAYDFVCEQLDIDSFVDNETAWNDFYMTWEAADNRNQMMYAAI